MIGMSGTDCKCGMSGMVKEGRGFFAFGGADEPITGPMLSAAVGNANYDQLRAAFEEAAFKLSKISKDTENPFPADLMKDAPIPDQPPSDHPDGKAKKELNNWAKGKFEPLYYKAFGKDASLVPLTTILYKEVTARTGPVLPKDAEGEKDFFEDNKALLIGGALLALLYFKGKK